MSDHEIVYDNFWKNLIEKDGEIDLDIVKQELFGYYFLLNQANLVYSSITQGKMNTQNTAYEVLDAMTVNLNENYEKFVAMHREEDKKEIESLKTEVNSLMQTLVYGE